MVKWSKIFDNDHGQILKSRGQNWLFLTMNKISELPWLNGQNWSILTIDHGKFQVVMVMVKFFDR